MTGRSKYAPGTPSWVDIGTEVDGAKAFYGSLFGWTATDAGPVEETGGYGFFLKGDAPVAGYGPQQNPGPPFWSTYVSVPDADATAAKVTGAGGTVVTGPMQVMEQGRMAVFQDRQGVLFSAWEPDAFRGAQLVNEPGSIAWTELHTRDRDDAEGFYSSVFGWSPFVRADDQMSYTEFQLDGQPIAGMLDVPPMVPAEVPGYWLVYFAVDDTDATLEAATGLGASVLLEPMDLPVGRFAVLTDPQGAQFAIIKLAPQT